MDAESYSDYEQQAQIQALAQTGNRMADIDSTGSGSGSGVVEKQTRVGFQKGNTHGKRWKKGESGNPGGRKKGAVSIAAALKRALTQKDADELARLWLDMAKADPKAFEMVIERIDGRVPAGLHVTTEVHRKVILLERRSCPSCACTRCQEGRAAELLIDVEPVVPALAMSSVADAEVAVAVRSVDNLATPAPADPNAPKFTE